MLLCQSYLRDRSRFVLNKIMVFSENIKEGGQCFHLLTNLIVTPKRIIGVAFRIKT